MTSHIICLLVLAFFIQHNIWCSSNSLHVMVLILCLYCVIFQPMNTLQSIYPFYVARCLGCFLVSGYYESCCFERLHICLCHWWWTYILLSLGCVARAGIVGLRGSMFRFSRHSFAIVLCLFITMSTQQDHVLCSMFPVNWPFNHSIMSLSISGNFLYSKVYFFLY